MTTVPNYSLAVVVAQWQQCLNTVATESHVLRAHDFHSFSMIGLLSAVQPEYNFVKIYYLNNITISDLLKMMCVNISFLSDSEHSAVRISSNMFY